MRPGGFALLHLVLTRACNLRCAYCYQRRGPPRHMAPATLTRALEWATAAGRPGCEVVFSGGEPLLEMARIREAVATAPSLRYVLLTNGILLDDETIDFCARHAFELQISFDGVAQEMRAPDTSAVLESRLRRLLGGWPDYARAHVTVAVTVAPPAAGRLAETVELLMELGVPRISLAPELAPRAGTADLDAQFERIERLSRERFARDGSVPLLGLRPGAPPSDCGSLCGAAHALQPAVDVDGRVYGCALLVEPALAGAAPWMRAEMRRLAIGRIDDSGLDRRMDEFVTRAARSPLLAGRERRHSVRGRCVDCEWAATCAVCPVAAGLLAGNDDPGRVPDFACDFARAALGARARFLAACPPDPMARFLGVAELPPALRRVKTFVDAARGEAQRALANCGSGE
jgi:MoaA/NifB/PqqE/SkfB family radical SAM enzyme